MKFGALWVYCQELALADFGRDPRRGESGTLVIFGHAHLDSRTDSQALRAEYCIVGIPYNTAI